MDRIALSSVFFARAREAISAEEVTLHSVAADGTSDATDLGTDGTPGDISRDGQWLVLATRGDGKNRDIRLEEVATAVAEDKSLRSLEAVDLLQHLMSVLSPQQRAALDLVDLQGFTAPEAAEMLEVAPATVRVHLHRAREALRGRLGGEGSAEGTYG